MSAKKIRILIVDDSDFAIKTIAYILKSENDMEIVGTAKNGEGVLKQAQILAPTLILLDINMPKMDGIETTKQIMAYRPTPILIMSSNLETSMKKKVFEMISCGALEAIDKKSLSPEASSNGIRKKFIQMIRDLSGIKVITHPLAKLGISKVALPLENFPRKIVAIASSTGGPQAILEVFKNISGEITFPIVLVQHLSPGFDSGLVDWLNGELQGQAGSKGGGYTVCLAKNNQQVQEKFIYLAPSEMQMEVTATGTLSLTEDYSDRIFKPSADILLKSVAQYFGAHALGIILTGMGSDGAEGILEIFRRGGMTLGQDEKSCAVFGMPKSAIELGGVVEVVPLEGIPQRIIKWCVQKKGEGQ